jgi:hypothetical protein
VEEAEASTELGVLDELPRRALDSEHDSDFSVSKGLGVLLCALVGC